MDAEDLSREEYERISKRKQMGQATTEDSLQAQKHYWQNFFLTKELSEEVLKNFIYGANPFYNYRGLIDAMNRLAEGDLKSKEQLEKIEIVSALLGRLGMGECQRRGTRQEERRQGQFRGRHRRPPVQATEACARAF